MREYLIETDLIIAYFNRADRMHETSFTIFKQCLAGGYRIGILQSALLEYELALKAKGVDENTIKADLEDMATKIKVSRNLVYLVPLTISQQIKAIEIRNKYGFSYFDSLHVAAAIIHNAILITTDTEVLRYKEIPAKHPDQILTSSPQ